MCCLLDGLLETWFHKYGFCGLQSAPLVGCGQLVPAMVVASVQYRTEPLLKNYGMPEHYEPLEHYETVAMIPGREDRSQA